MEIDILETYCREQIASARKKASQYAEDEYRPIKVRSTEAGRVKANFKCHSIPTAKCVLIFRHLSQSDHGFGPRAGLYRSINDLDQQLGAYSVVDQKMASGHSLSVQRAAPGLWRLAAIEQAMYPSHRICTLDASGYVDC